MAESGFERVKAAFHRVQTEHPPKGEVWLGEDILKKAEFEDSLGGRLKFIEQTKQDLICLSIAQEPHVNEALGYRYFPVSAVAEVLETTDLFIMAVIDGPFQRLADKVGLMKVFTGWFRERESLLRAYEHERKGVDDLLECCLEHSVHGVVIADDLAGDQSTFFDPLIIERSFFPFYHQAVSKIHEAHAVALFHSCGNIAGIMPQLLYHGFDGLAAVQDRTNDLAMVKARYGSELVLMGGIEGEILEKEAFAPSDFEALGKRLRLLAQNGGLILSSSCGLYSGRFLEKISAIYGLI